MEFNYCCAWCKYYLVWSKCCALKAKHVNGTDEKCDHFVSWDAVFTDSEKELE